MSFSIFIYLLAYSALGTGHDDARIIGGEPISIEQVPFMALFRPVSMPFFCGACIVSDRFLVTAAHCVVTKFKMEVTVGTNRALGGGKRYEIEKTFIHPDSKPFRNDLAVIKVKNKLSFNSRVQPIKMAEPGIQIEDNAEFQVVGFGRTETGPSSNILLSVKVPHVPPQTCKKMLGKFITNRTICAGETNKGACFGDSGGPLVYGGQLVGVMAFGTIYCDKPVVFSRISAFREFIDTVMRNN